MNIKEENVKLVQQLYSAFAKRDINWIMANLSQDVEWGEPSNPYNPSGGTRHGHQGFLEWANIGSQCEEILFLNPEKMLTDNDSVAVVGRMKCKAIPTAKTYECDFVHLVTIKNGKVTKFQEFFDTYLAGEAFRV